MFQSILVQCGSRRKIKGTVYFTGHSQSNSIHSYPTPLHFPFPLYLNLKLTNSPSLPLPSLTSLAWDLKVFCTVPFDCGPVTALWHNLTAHNNNVSYFEFVCEGIGNKVIDWGKLDLGLGAGLGGGGFVVLCIVGGLIERARKKREVRKRGTELVELQTGGGGGTARVAND